MFKWETDNPILDHKVTINGLLSGDDTPAYVNLLIDGIDSQQEHTSSTLKPNMVTLRCFKTIAGSLNIIEGIGTKYSDFGVLLLNDESGNYIDSLERQLHGNCKDINTKTLKDWMNGRKNAKPFTWDSLLTTLRDIGLCEMANKIEDAL